MLYPYSFWLELPISVITTIIFILPWFCWCDFMSLLKRVYLLLCVYYRYVFNENTFFTEVSQRSFKAKFHSNDLCVYSFLRDFKIILFQWHYSKSSKIPFVTIYIPSYQQIVRRRVCTSSWHATSYIVSYWVPVINDLLTIKWRSFVWE